MIFKLVLLLLIANGSPVIIAKILGPRFDWPVDFGRRLGGQALFGPSKTWRGIIASLIATSLTAWLLGLGFAVGALIAAMAMLGDLLASFSKRRLGLNASSMAPGLDQIPESLLPLWAVREQMGLDWPMLLMLVLAFIVMELLLSRLGYALRLRKHPY